MQMHYRNDFNVIRPFSKKHAVGKAGNTTFANVHLDDAKKQRIAFDSRECAFYNFNEPKPQSFLFVLVITNGFAKFFQRRRMKPDWFQASDSRSLAIAVSAGMVWTFPSSSS